MKHVARVELVAANLHGRDVDRHERRLFVSVTAAGALVVNNGDDEITVYAPGTWRRADVANVPETSAKGKTP